MLFFRHRNTNDPVVGAFEESVLETLRRRCSQTIWTLPHLYDLPDSWPGFQEIAGGPLYVFSWLSARAAAAILRPRFPTMDLTCFDLEELKTTAGSGSDHLDWICDEINRSLTLPEAVLLRTAQEIGQSEKPLRHRWYPVIDYQECQNCLECVNFCLFGVYTIGENQVPLVEQPDQCRHGCPACARVCPAGAILFPEYDDPMISGRLKHTNKKDDLDNLIDQVEL